MGCGVAEVAASANIKVVLVDKNADVLELARRKISHSLRTRRLVGGRQGSEPTAAILDRIHMVTDHAPLAEVDFLVENVTESWEAKADLYPRIDAVCRNDCIFAANTSCLSITRIAASTRRADRMVGIHFMNPVPAIAAVEVVRGFHTSRATLDATSAFLGQIGMTPIVVEDMPGFVSNRILMLTVNEAMFVVQDQVADPETVDRIFRDCFGHRMGPLATADLIGLDTILASLEVLLESYGDPKFRPAPLLKKMVHAGLLGRKSGRGFFVYDDVQ
jgi:3-hydroxybutyryl-CoA dehydrogenase